MKHRLENMLNQCIFYSTMNNIKIKRLMCYASGAMRGVYYAGVMRALDEAGIEFEDFAGISVGSTAAAWHAAGQAANSLDTWLAISIKKLSIHPCLNNETSKNLDWLIANQTLPRLDVEALKRSGKSIYIGVSEVQSMRHWPKERFLRKFLKFKDDFDTGQLLMTIRASCHMPFINGIFSATIINEKRYLDGGLTGRIPIDSSPLESYDEVWLAAASPKSISELNSRIAIDVKKKLRIISPSKTLPIGRIEIDKIKFQDTAEIGYYNAVDAIKAYLEQVPRDG